MDKKLEGYIFVVTHKDYPMPIEKIYMPITVGKNKQKLTFNKFYTDDALENRSIAKKNDSYCELTALYAIWQDSKFSKLDYMGLVHYRRYFTEGKVRKKNKFEHILSEKRVLKLFKQYDVILPKIRHYFIETNYSHYAHAHNVKDLDTTRSVIEELHPEYLADFDQVMKKTSGHRFNLMIMKKEKLDAYCQWLFSILFEVENRIDCEGYDPYQTRVFGFLSERLLDVWIQYQQVSYYEQNYSFMEKENWVLKGKNFLMRKIKRKSLVKYD